MKKGILAVVSGFSGAGKGSLMRELLQRHGEQYALSISATTRPPREGEEHGREYFFVSKEEFERMIEEEALIEYACYVGNYYGTPKEYVLEQMEAGRDVILEIEIQGALKVKERFPDALLLFVTPPSAGELEKRLRGRGTETDEVILCRLKRAAEEAEFMEDYDYILVNDNLEVCASEMHALIQSQHLRTGSSQEWIARIREELCRF
ncbi:MAG: guanylate kinase [Lachnospiraceae bacterium]|nr:guanylate kinase [Lachnospiraceae bacterium]